MQCSSLGLSVTLGVHGTALFNNLGHIHNGLGWGYRLQKSHSNYDKAGKQRETV